MGTIGDVIASQPVAAAIAGLAPEDRDHLVDGLDSIHATCRSRRDSLVVLARVFAAEADDQGRRALAHVWTEIADTAGDAPVRRLRSGTAAAGTRSSSTDRPSLRLTAAAPETASLGHRPRPEPATC